MSTDGNPSVIQRVVEVLRTWLDVASIGIRVWPFGAVFAVVVFPLMGLATPIAAVALGRTVDRFVAGSTAASTTWLVVYVFLTVTLILMFNPHQYIVRKVGPLVQQEVNKRLMASSLEAAGIQHLEDPEYADTLAAVQSRPEAFISIVWNIGETVSYVGALIFATVALLAVHPALMLAPVAAGVVGAYESKAQRRLWGWHESAESLRRRALVYHWMCTASEPAKETRLLGLTGHAFERFRNLSRGVLQIETRGRLLDSRIGFLRAVVHGGAFALGIVWMAHLATLGRATPGDVVMGVAMLQEVLGIAGQISHAGGRISHFRWLAAAYRRLIDHQSPVRSPDEPVEVPARLTKGIRFNKVSFSYPGTDRKVLSEVTLNIPAGRTVALVGENGAGKTTLVKLLCRFYDPTSGEITVDGIDLRALDPPQWCSAMTGSFQDYAEFKFLMRETIGVGEVSAIEDLSRITAAARLGGAGSVVEMLGVEAQLGKEFGGADVSQGEWQKLALSRGVMRSASLVTILDEPTASLDPLAEQEVFERFSELARSGRDRGSITVLVSHRFSTVRMAELIIVVDGGRIREAGSHEELMARRDLYAELFAAQAGTYRE